ADEFFWVPTVFFRQIARSTMARRLVPLRMLEGVSRLTELGRGPKTEARITFMTGLDNRCFAPQSQLLSYRYMTAWQPGRHELVELPGYGHLDVSFSQHSAADVFPAVIDGLER